MASLIDMDDNDLVDTTPKTNGGSQELLDKAEEQMRELDLIETAPVKAVSETQNHLEDLSQQGLVEESNNLIDTDTPTPPPSKPGSASPAALSESPKPSSETVSSPIPTPNSNESTPTPKSSATTPTPKSSATTPTPKSSANTPTPKATATTPTGGKPAKPATDSPVSKPPTPSKTPKTRQPISQQRAAGVKTNGVTGAVATPPKTLGGTAAKKVTSPVSPGKAPPSARAMIPSARRASAPPPNSGSPTAEGATAEVKKVPMNKVKVGGAPSPNIKEVKSKVGSLEGTTHKAGGGKVQITHTKLAWKAESKVGSMSNLKYQPAGGNVKVRTIESHKVDTKGATSKIGSLQNVKHKPGGGEKKIFDDKEYLKKSNPSSKTPSEHGGETSVPQSPTPQGEGALVGVDIGQV